MRWRLPVRPRPVRPRPQISGTQEAQTRAARTAEGRAHVPPPPEGAERFLALQIQALGSRGAMENSGPDPADDTSMDAFLDKFQSQPYRGGFREDQWEEVSVPGGSAGVECGPPALIAAKGRVASS